MTDLDCASWTVILDSKEGGASRLCGGEVRKAEQCKHTQAFHAQMMDLSVARHLKSTEII